ncbi:S-adenosyl-L-methionine-dependent methyltransferase [Trichoderma citrinoviride]|uniref:S-adenosyl-L-methionine-dependent methyltransferase n=1 Tax=Trichoderma citrinoviride TaxID=58853 RepID=A0A2T4BB00_9HYPO|nr:S-adenosyl-L-methionine-dependent methyltransferase [Trichoderma citrinoviride]PTB66496.1 S-adenosyl-L-methionine-dependent methyltransferase [Trichoderma citrinoviride]
MGDSSRNQDRPSPGKAPATGAEPAEAKVGAPRKPSIVVSEDPPNIEEQDPPLDAATDSEDIDGEDDDDYDDGTDGYSAESVTVRSSIWEHEYEGGRRYHHYRHGRYPLPNDDIEQEREYMKHVIHMQLTGGKLFNAPIAPNPQRILDLCTGTGLWPIEGKPPCVQTPSSGEVFEHASNANAGRTVAKMFPSAEIIGLDLSPIQPLMVPPNVRFLIDDVEDEWMDRGGYDMIHLRHSCIYLKDVDKLIANCYAHLKEGGWLEITDYCGYIRCDDGTMPEDHPPAQVAMLMHRALRGYGMNVYVINELHDKYKAAGFKNIQCRVTKTPIGAWPRDPGQREIGILFRDIIHELVGALAAKPLRTLGWDDTELEVYLAAARRGLWDRKVHCYANFISWWAQK